MWYTTFKKKVLHIHFYIYSGQMLNIRRLLEYFLYTVTLRQNLLSE